MQRPFWKQFWFWAVLVLVLGVLISSLPPVQTEYHKWRLQSTKARKARLLGAIPSGLDRFWLHVTGAPASGAELDAAIRKHERALVGLGFLQQAKLPAEMISKCAQSKESLAVLESECPWYHAETVFVTNLVVTTCPKMMERWRKDSRELGW